MTVHSLGYLRLSSADLPGWHTFATDVLGMTATTAAPEDGLAFRMDEYPARLVLVPGETGAIEGIGFETGGRAGLHAVVESLSRRGITVRTGSAAECAERRVREVAFCADPFGIPLEFFYGPALDHTPLAGGHVSGFVAGPLGMGHVVLGGENADEALDFYTRTLGFTDRNTMRATGGDGRPSQERITFLGCNPRHHTVALMRRPAPSHMIHFMVEMNTLDDVGRAHDRALALGIPQRLTLGRHTNDGMVSFYSLTPDGFTLEIGCEGRTVAPGEPTYEITATSYWGHRKVHR